MIYECECKKCGRVEDYVSSIAERDKVPLVHCGKTMVKIISATMGPVIPIAHSNVYDPVKKKWISGDKLEKHYRATGTVHPSEGNQEAKRVDKKKKDDHRKSMREAMKKSWYLHKKQ